MKPDTSPGRTSSHECTDEDYFGRKKWEPENREYTTNEPQIQSNDYKSAPPDESLRAYLFDVRRALDKQDSVMVDVRSPKEFSGEITAPRISNGTCTTR